MQAQIETVPLRRGKEGSNSGEILKANYEKIWWLSGYEGGMREKRGQGESRLRARVEGGVKEC